MQQYHHPCEQKSRLYSIKRPQKESAHKNEKENDSNAVLYAHHAHTY